VQTRFRIPDGTATPTQTSPGRGPRIASITSSGDFAPIRRLAPSFFDRLVMTAVHPDLAAAVDLVQPAAGLQIDDVAMRPAVGSKCGNVLGHVFGKVQEQAAAIATLICCIPTPIPGPSSCRSMIRAKEDRIILFAATGIGITDEWSQVLAARVEIATARRGSRLDLIEQGAIASSLPRGGEHHGSPPPPRPFQNSRMRGG